MVPAHADLREGRNLLSTPVLKVSDLRTEFDTPDGVVYAVNGVSFEVRPGEFIGVVGESGSGKSVTMMSLLRLIPMPPGRVVSGSAEFDDQDLLALDMGELRTVRGGKIGFIFQDPMTSLNPVLTIGHQITEPLKLHLRCDRKTANETAANLLTMVGLPDAKQRLKSYPHELSGGMRQRVMIAIALACSPQLLIADEPTTALDVTVQAQIIEIVRNLRDQLGTAMIWITHDLGVIAGLADRVIVMYGGEIVEEARVADLYQRPEHPYTQGLLRSIPRLDQKGSTLESIKGTPPNLYAAPTACTFAPRCPHAFERCIAEVPVLIEVGDDHRVACWWDTTAEAPRDV
jgi:peptide/nickel transport system ATP-binding protein/oligopeptide transport system ATP-binding protein